MTLRQAQHGFFSAPQKIFDSGFDPPSGKAGISNFYPVLKVNIYALQNPINQFNPCHLCAILHFTTIFIANHLSELLLCS
jgi:hypothetical protein